MTGLEALAEAARLETARIYATPSTEHRQAVTTVQAPSFDELAEGRDRKNALQRLRRAERRQHA